MLIKVPSVVNLGLATVKVDVEVNLANRGLPGFEIVGLPSKAVDESKERVRTAIINSGVEPVSLNLKIATSGGAEDGNAICKWGKEEGAYIDNFAALLVLNKHFTTRITYKLFKANTYFFFQTGR